MAQRYASPIYLLGSDGKPFNLGESEAVKKLREADENLFQLVLRLLESVLKASEEDKEAPGRDETDKARIWWHKMLPYPAVQWGELIHVHVQEQPGDVEKTKLADLLDGALKAANVSQKRIKLLRTRALTPLDRDDFTQEC